MTRFTEDWFSATSCRVLADLARTTDRLDGAVIEVGCWEGRSTIALANAIHPATLHAVDTWAGSPGEISAELAAERDVFDTFTANIAEATAGNVAVHRMGWRDFFADWSDPVRFIHIDAEHSYTEVRENIEAVLPYVVAGGIVCGDDQHHPPVREAVMDTLGNAMVAASLWYRQVNA